MGGALERTSAAPRVSEHVGRVVIGMSKGSGGRSEIFRSAKDERLSFWCDRRELSRIDASARTSNMTRSEYLRALCGLVACEDERALSLLSSVPLQSGRDSGRAVESVAFRCPRADAEALRGFSAGVGLSVSATLRAIAGSAVLFALDGTQSRGEGIACVTDSAVWELALQIKRIGTNYNQAVHAINSIASWVRSAECIDNDEAKSIWEILKGVAKTNEGVGLALEELAEKTGDLSDRTGFPLRTGMFMTKRRPVGGR